MNKPQTNTEAPKKLRVTFYQRRPQEANHSIERVFADVRQSLPNDIEAKVAVSRFVSKGLWRRVFNVFEAPLRQGDVNHITGDVHFLTYFIRGKRTLLTIHDLVCVHRLKGWRRAMLLFCWYWLPIRRAAVVSVISESTKTDLLRHIKVDPRKVRVVHDSVSAVFQPDFREFRIKKPVILQIGTGANKNVERVAQALQGISCHLRVVGKLGEDQIKVLKECGVEHSSASNISDVQVVDEYRQCDILVFVSTYEGFGLPIIEAQATGRAVITSNVLSMPEVAGDAACFVDPADIESIRAGILKVISDSEYRDELVRRGFENVKRFQSKQIAKQYVDIYRELIENKRE